MGGTVMRLDDGSMGGDKCDGCDGCDGQSESDDSDFRRTSLVVTVALAISIAVPGKTLLARIILWINAAIVYATTNNERFIHIMRSGIPPSHVIHTHHVHL